MNELKREFEIRIKNAFSSEDSMLSYLLDTKKNFLYRYLETTNDTNLELDNHPSNTFTAKSYETNLGTALKISDLGIKEGIKTLAKCTPKELLPKIQYSLTTQIEDLSPNRGRIKIEAMVNWDFPKYNTRDGFYKSKAVFFEYNDLAQFRKFLALKFEEACDIFN